MGIDKAIELLNSIVKVNRHFLQGIENQTINQNEIQAIEILINEYNNLKQIEEAHRIENGKLREENEKLNAEVIENICYRVDTEVFEEMREELKQEKEKNKKLQIRGKELIEEKQELNTALLYDNISKDKIRAKIKELEEKSEYWNCDEIEVLKELLEEE